MSDLVIFEECAKSSNYLLYCEAQYNTLYWRVRLHGAVELRYGTHNIAAVSEEKKGGHSSRPKAEAVGGRVQRVVVLRLVGFRLDFDDLIGCNSFEFFIDLRHEWLERFNAGVYL
ncbi:MAG: hypothetical protein ACR2G4_05645 [Pyrinomonadaceae bacterium]